jgi:hypothetical protein
MTMMPADDLSLARSSVVKLARLFGLQVVDAQLKGPPEDLVGFASRPPGRLATAKAWGRSQRIREDMLGKDHFADPAWDMLLDLYIAQYEKRTVSISSACIASHVPSTTALRWITALEGDGWLVRADDPKDGRRVYLTLPARMISLMDQIMDRVVESDRRLGLERVRFV